MILTDNCTHSTSFFCQIHGNVCMASVVVTDTLDWKLHGFDMLSDHSSVEYSPLRDYAFLVGDQYKSAEVAKGEWSLIPQQPPWAVDAWGLGCLLQEVFAGHPMVSVDQLRETDHIPEALIKDYQRLLNSQAAKRQNPSRVAKSKFLNNQLVDAVNFLENLAVKESTEKDSFFRKLPSILPALPAPVAEQKLLPMLASALEFGGAPAAALSCILQIGRGMTEADFAERVIPCISGLFTSNDRAIRRGLLENIEKFAVHMDQKLVEEQVFPNLQSGFTDNNAYIRELTLKSMRSLAPKMTQKTLNQSLLKFLAKLQVDQEPTIRANTTVLLGSIADLLGEAACKRVLLNAFQRALRDQFPHARVAGLKALISTQKTHSPEDIAQRVIPMVAPLAVDGLQDARQAALQCLDSFCAVLKEHSESMAIAAEASEANPGAQASMNKPSDSSGYLGWAASSLGLGAKATKGDDHGVPNPASYSSGPLTQHQNQDPPQHTIQDPQSTRPNEATMRPENSWEADHNDGWDDEELGDLEVDQEEAEARKRLSRISHLAGRARAASKPEPQPDNVSKDTDGWDDDDDDDDVWEGMGMKASTPSLVASNTRPTVRSSARSSVGKSGTSGATARKPMKLGAQKLKKADFDF